LYEAVLDSALPSRPVHGDLVASEPPAQLDEGRSAEEKHGA